MEELIMSKWTRRILSLVLALLLLCGITSAGMIQASAAATKTQAEAVSWLKSCGKIDYDGVAGVQCVDLIYAYYNYLGATVMGGNAKDYVSNKLPTGWSRITKANVGTPQPGDIIVQGAGVGGADATYGHVSIAISATSNTNRYVVHQRGGNLYRETQNGNYTCVIRPQFRDGPSTPITLTGLTAKNITSVSARLEATLSPSISMSEHGVYIGKRSDTTLTQIKGAQNGTITYSGSLFFEIGTKYYKELSPGTEYQYYFYVVSDGKTYKSETKYFTTSGATTYRVDLCSNFSGKNYVAYSDFSSLNTSYYYSRDTSVYTISTDSANANGGYNSLKIVGSAAGTTSKSLSIVTHTNHCKADGGIGDNKNMTLSFYAKASVSGTRMYWRWGNSPTTNVANVTLTTSWQKYTIALNKTDAA